ncbi:hypothetical protein MRX96_035629 [Rhipicephalus microplus]|uniref:GH18 domain-containing protein n=1 Tax=Rhipicephalus microplus TaxID=6941 RepID=A0A9J6EW18_RHIMP|nr:hypothetical protein HPB51_001497 [Rhipicephalus microplus]
MHGSRDTEDTEDVDSSAATSRHTQDSQTSVSSSGSKDTDRKLRCSSLPPARSPRTLPKRSVKPFLRDPSHRVRPDEDRAVGCTDYPIQRATTEDLDRLVVLVHPQPSSRRGVALMTRLQPRTEFRRIRDSFSQLWFLCILALAALSVPAGLVLAPIIRLQVDQALREVAGPTAPRFATPYPWTGVPRECLRSVRINDVIRKLHVEHPAPLLTRAKHRGDLICVFNNSRFRKQLLWDYVPASMPLPFCQSLLYWSVAVNGGKVHDRTPDFDVNYGVWRLKKLASSISANEGLPDIMVALGGYVEDGAHFSRLGRDTALMSRFVASAATFLFKHNITGALVDWKGIGGHCGSKDDAKTLSRILQKLGGLLRLNGIEYQVGAVVAAVKGIAKPLTKAIAAVADIIVYETHETVDYNVYEGCSKAAGLTLQFMGDMSRAIGAVKSPPRLCISLSAGVWSTLAYDLAGTSVVIGGSGFYKISRRTGMAAAFEMCTALAYSSVVKNDSLAGCILYNLRAVNVSSEEVVVESKTIPVATAVDRLFVYENTDAIVTQADATTTPSRRRCVAIYDLDFDNFRGVCEYQNLPNHFRLTHIDSALA